MNLVVKYAEAIQDRTVHESALVEGFEMVLVDEFSCSLSEDIALDNTMENESIDPSIEEMIKNARWVELSQAVAATPGICQTRFPTSGNLLLHEACIATAPLWFIDVLVRSYRDALTKKGRGGYLPLHFACAHQASADVIVFLISEFTGSIHMVESTERMLPLHLACKHGIAEEAMMVLLSSFPEATMVKDAFGRTPMDFARNQTNPLLRNATMSYLERGGWLCSASAAARHWAELAHKKKMDELEEKNMEEKAIVVSKVEALQSIVASNEEMIAGLQTKIENQTKELGNDVDREHQTVLSLRKEVEEKKIELKCALEKMANLEETFGERICQLEETFKKGSEEATAKYETEKLGLMEIISTLREENAALHDHTSTQAAHIDRLKKQDAEFDQNLKIMVDQIAMLQSALSETKSSLERANTRLVRATIRNSELASLLQTKEAERQSAMDEVEELRQNAEYMTSLMTSIRHLAGNGVPVSWRSAPQGISKKNSSRMMVATQPEKLAMTITPNHEEKPVEEETHDESRADDICIGGVDVPMASSRE